MQESNTFSPALAQLSEFHILTGPDIAHRFAGTNSEIGGFLKACAQRGGTPLPVYSASATSGGPLSSECFETITNALVSALAAEPVDGVLLALHGAMSTEHYPSGDAEICRRVRAAL